LEPIAPKPFSKAMRSGVVGPATRGLLGALLFLLTTRTAKYFAWTIEPPLTAAVLGANYLGNTLLAILASCEPLWAQAADLDLRGPGVLPDHDRRDVHPSRHVPPAQQRHHHGHHGGSG